MRNTIFILSHQDDEFGVFESIRLAIKKNENVIIFYMTSGEINKRIPKNKIYYRDKESLKVLQNIGVKSKNIIFFGRLNNIPTCMLHYNMDKAYKKILNFLNKIKNEINIYTHCWEGGNEDHDACNIIVKKLIKNCKNIKQAYQFPLYNADNKFFYYSVQKILKKNGRVYKLKTHFRNRINYIKYLFYYTSQLRVWLGLYPFLIYNLISRDYFILQKLTHKINFSKPHTGKLLYEKFNRCTYKKFSSNMLKFINNN